MAKMPAGMTGGDTATETPVEQIEVHERMLSTRLEGLRWLKAALEPFYASLDDAQKAIARAGADGHDLRFEGPLRHAATAPSINARSPG